MENDSMTANEAARILGVSPATIARMVRRGELRGHKLSLARNSPLRIYRASVEELLSRREQVPKKE